MIIIIDLIEYGSLNGPLEFHHIIIALELATVSAYSVLKHMTWVLNLAPQMIINVNLLTIYA